MKTLKLFIIVLFIFSCNRLFAQSVHFTIGGTIEFEKSVNMYAIIKKLYGNEMNGFLQQAFDQYKKTQPQFKILKSTLTFANNKTLFTPIAPENAPGGFFSIPATDQNNIVYSDMETHTGVTQKIVFEQTFLVKDSLRKIKWKITGETRTIAGYACRRANGLMLDSIYVVAFYTDQIPVSGGPESFAGLPGMILEVALPHENLTWRATKVTDVNIDPSTLSPPKKGKPVNNKQLGETLNGATKDWGAYGQVYLKLFIM